MKANDNAVAAVKAGATQRANDLKDILDHWRAAGVTSLSAIARHLNGAGILNARGGKWHPSSTKNAILRLENHNL